MLHATSGFANVGITQPKIDLRRRAALDMVMTIADGLAIFNNRLAAAVGRQDEAVAAAHLADALVNTLLPEPAFKLQPVSSVLRTDDTGCKAKCPAPGRARSQP